MDALKRLACEFYGIRSVFYDYTDSEVVSNYINQLEEGIRRADGECILYCLDRLVSWYDEEWDEMSCYADCKIKEQGKNRELLQSLLSELRDYDFTKIKNKDERDGKKEDEPIIFLSHSSSNKQYADALEKMFTGIGIKNEQLIYTSHALHKIPLGQNIYDYLRSAFEKKLFVIILWSNEYLESSACLNEMGAAWVTRSDYTNIYCPDFDFKNPKYYSCAVDKNRMGAILDGTPNCKASMTELKDIIMDMFGLGIDEKSWLFILDEFIKDISLK